MKLLYRKLLPISPQNHPIKFDFSSRVFASFYSTEPDPQTLPPSSSSSPSSLYHRIERIRDPKASISPILDQWVKDGNPVGEELRFLVARMKSFKRYHHALQISDWISARTYLKVTTKDVATRLDLIYRVHGLAAAEEYFNYLSKKIKWGNVYGNLLNIYTQEKCVEKAEALLQEMKEKKMGNFSYPHNLLINLYCKVGKFEKIDYLLEEMRINGIPHDKYTTNNLVAAYATEPNIPRMEELIRKIEEDPKADVPWSLYTTAANGYMKVGSAEKALAFLKKAEGMMPTHRRTCAVEFLLTLYAKAGDKDEVYRVWNAYKSSSELFSNLYGCMISCLSKLDDLEGAEKVYEEFQSRTSGFFDFRVLNRLLVAYCNRGLMEKAESAAEKAAVGRLSYASTWQILANGYLELGQMEKAVEMLKRALAIARRDWIPHQELLDSCLDYLEKKGDAEGMEDVAKLLKNVESYDGDLYPRLVRTYIAAGQSADSDHDSVTMSGSSS